MSPTTKLKIDDVTKWLSRLSLVVLASSFSFFMTLFYEVRDDVKILIHNDAVNTQKVQDLERDLEEQKVIIEKIRDEL